MEYLTGVGSMVTTPPCAPANRNNPRSIPPPTLCCTSLLVIPPAPLQPLVPYRTEDAEGCLPEAWLPHLNEFSPTEVTRPQYPDPSLISAPPVYLTIPPTSGSSSRRFIYPFARGRDCLLPLATHAWTMFIVLWRDYVFDADYATCL